jgi:putative oxidoreductase
MVSHRASKWHWQGCHFIHHNRHVEVRQFGANLGIPTARLDVALLVLRVASGLAFLYHGAAILFGVFGGPGPERFAIDHRFPVALGYLIGLAQVASATAVLLGVFVRFAAGVLIVVMLGAIFLVHLPHGFDVSNGGFEYALTQLLIAFALLLMGAGSYSVASRLPAGLKGL